MAKIKPLTHMHLYTMHRPLDVVLHWRKNDMLLMDTPYQRGFVWGETRQRNLIKSILMGIPIPSIIVNDRSAGGWPEEDVPVMAVIDGKQRITTILRFLDSELSIPSEWVGGKGNTLFRDMPIAKQRRIKNGGMAFSEGALPNLRQEEEVYELVNFGGVPQGQSD